VTNSEALKEEIQKNGLTCKEFADLLGITRQGLYNKLNNKRDFRQSEISRCIEILHLSKKQIDEIFFNHEGGR